MRLIPGSPKPGYCNLEGAIGDLEPTILQLDLENLAQLVLAKVLKDKGLIKWEPSAGSRVDVAVYFLHLVFVPGNEHAPVIYGNGLNLANDGVDNDFTEAAIGQLMELVDE